MTWARANVLGQWCVQQWIRNREAGLKYLVHIWGDIPVQLSDKNTVEFPLYMVDLYMNKIQVQPLKWVPNRILNAGSSMIPPHLLQLNENPCNCCLLSNVTNSRRIWMKGSSKQIEMMLNRMKQYTIVLKLPSTSFSTSNGPSSLIENIKLDKWDWRQHILAQGLDEIAATHQKMHDGFGHCILNDFAYNIIVRFQQQPCYSNLQSLSLSLSIWWPKYCWWLQYIYTTIP